MGVHTRPLDGEDRFLESAVLRGGLVEDFELELVKLGVA